MANSGYAAFIDECRAERASLARLVDVMEKGKLGVGLPITQPRINDATAAMIVSCKRSIADMDTLIAAYEAEPPVV